MPSTYSPDLRIELIANGEQSGTWGDTTNTNLGTLVEDAISGLATVATLSADQALTALNGAADESRCAAINLTTLTTAPFNVYVPPVTKLYVVVNSSAYIATIYCSTVLGNTTAAGAGVSIPPGKSVLIRADGVDVFEQLDYIVGNFSIGGDITIGGTTTLSADPTLALQAATKQYVDSAASGSSPSGALIMWPTGTAPSGWLLCNGQAVSRTLFAGLFAVIGTTFGVGDGSTTFNVPDYRDRMPIGSNTIAASVGATGGSKDAIVVSHSHTATASTEGAHNHVSGYAQGGAVAPRFGLRTGLDSQPYADAAGSAYNTTTGANTSTEGAHTHTITVDPAGTSGTDANLPPYLGINFIIKT